MHTIQWYVDAYGEEDRVAGAPLFLSERFEALNKLHQMKGWLKRFANSLHADRVYRNNFRH